MKALAGLLYKYAIPRNMAPNGLNLGQYLIVGDGDTGSKEALPTEAVKVLEDHVGMVKWADYVLCQCYLASAPPSFLLWTRSIITARSGRRRRCKDRRREGPGCHSFPKNTEDCG